MMNPRLMFSIMILLLVSCAGNKAPQWYSELPPDTEYYHGIGVVEKVNSSSQDYRQMARNMALTDIAGQIRVTIQSDLQVKSHESNAGIEEEVNFISKSRSDAVLTGVEQVEVFENENSYGVYYRLSKANYIIQAKRIYDLSLAEAHSYLKRADAPQSEPFQALQYQLYALNKLSTIQDLLTRYDTLGTYTNLIPEIHGSLAEWFSQLNFATEHNHANWVIPKGLRDPITIQITWDNNHDHVLMKRFPVKVLYGNSSFQIQANDAGEVNLESVHFDSISTTGIIMIEPDISELAGEQGKVMPFLKTLQFPEIQVNMVVNGPLIELTTSEKALGNLLIHNYITPIIKSTLQESVQAEFIDSGSKSPVDFVMVVTANSIEAGPPTKVYGKTIYKCLSSVIISLLDSKEREELFTAHLQDIDGASFQGFEAASQKSYAKLAEKFKAEVLPEIINIFRGDID